MSEPRRGKYGLWYVDGICYRFATREEALTHVVDERARRRQERRAKRRAIAKWTVLTGVSLLFAAVVATWWRGGAEERDLMARIEAHREEVQRSRSRALQACQEAIAVSATYGERRSPGHSDGFQTSGVWLFYWPDGSFYYQNAFGVEVPQSARCEVERETGRILSLVISGKEVLRNPATPPVQENAVAAPVPQNPVAPLILENAVTPPLPQNAVPATGG